MNKKAFSLIELLISLIIISLITRVFVPVLTKKTEYQNITIKGAAVIKCPEGYILAEDKKTCVPDIQDLYPSKENCKKINAVFIPREYNGTSGKDLCVSAYNAGDNGGPIIDKTKTYYCKDGQINNRLSSKEYFNCISKNLIVVKDASDTTSCASGACCWQGATGPKNACSSSDKLSAIKSNFEKFNYEACSRTVCNWYAAEGICKNFSYANGNITADEWRLPTANEVNGWRANINNVSNYQGSEGLQLCDNSTTNFGSPLCGCNTQGCLKSGSTNCKPYCIWSQNESDENNAYRFNLNNGAITGDIYDKPVTCSIRCVIEKFKGPSTI